MAVLLVVFAFLGGAIGALATILYQHFSRRRLRIGYVLLSAAPVVPFESGPGDRLRVMVRKELLPSHLQQAGEDEYQDAGRVYGFRILLRNTGSDTIKGDDRAPGVDVTFELDEGANILAVDVEEPALGPDDFTKDEHYQERPNTARLWLKYLNRDSDVVVSIQSVGNRDRTCRIDARAPDLQPAYDILRANRRWSWITVSTVLVIGIIPIAVAAVWGISLYGFSASQEEFDADGTRGDTIQWLQRAGAAWLLFWIVIGIGGIAVTLRRTLRGIDS